MVSDGAEDLEEELVEEGEAVHQSLPQLKRPTRVYDIGLSQLGHVSVEAEETRWELESKVKKEGSNQSFWVFFFL